LKLHTHRLKHPTVFLSQVRMIIKKNWFKKQHFCKYNSLVSQQQVLITKYKKETMGPQTLLKALTI
jgi:hypothetical protein